MWCMVRVDVVLSVVAQGVSLLPFNETSLSSFLMESLPPPKPGFRWAAYCKSIDGHVSVEFAVANIPAHDYYFEEIPIAQHPARVNALPVDKH